MTPSPETNAGRGPRRSRTRRALRAGGSATLIVVISFALIELGLQVASLFAEDRSGVWEPGAEVRVLCVGDSHTWGAGVSREQSYPAHLQNHLDELAPGRYSVLNHGLPGINTAQVRRRFPVWLQRYQPDVVVLWAGVNNAWNRADAEESSEIRYAWLEGLVSHLRTYRLVRVWLIVLLAVARLDGQGYGATIRQEVEERTGRPVAVGAIYATIDRLVTKGYLTARPGPSSPERGGRPKRYLRLEPSGVEALEATQHMMEQMWDGVDLRRGTPR